MPLNAGSYIPNDSGGALGFRLNQWIAHKLGVQTEADQALQDRLEKQAKQQRDEDWRAFEHQSSMYQDMLKGGWTPMETQVGGGASKHPGASLLQEGSTTTGMQQPPEGARITTDPYGTRWWKAAEAPKGTLTEEQALKAGGEPLDAQGRNYLGSLPPLVPGLPGEEVRVAPPPERVATTEAGSRLYLPTAEAQQAAKERAERGKDEAKAYTLPPEVTEAYEKGLGMKPGSLKDRALSNEAWNHIATSAKAPKPDTYQFTPDWTGPQGEPLVYDKTKNAMVPVRVPEGTKHILSPAQEEAKTRAEQVRQDAQERRDQTRRDSAQRAADQLENKEHEQYRFMAQYGELLKNPDFDPANPKVATRVVLPGSNTAATVRMKDVRGKYQAMYNEAQDKAAMYKRQKETVLRGVGVDTGTAPPQTPVQGPPQRAEQTQGPATRQAPATGSPSARAPAQQGAAVRYTDAGQTYNIPAGMVAQFLKDHPRARAANAR